jgi:hypothetical protein
MTIEHQIELPKKPIERKILLAKITSEIPEFFNWTAQLQNEKIRFEHDKKIRFLRMPTDFIKSGTIELTERTNTFLFTCRTNFPNYFILLFLGVFVVGLTQKYLFNLPFPLAVIIALPVILYFGNWFYIKRTFKWSTNKIIRHVMQNEVGS